MDYPNGLILIRNGFARVTRAHGSRERTLSYLGKGSVFGLEEVAHNRSVKTTDATVGMQCSLARDWLCRHFANPNKGR